MRQKRICIRIKNTRSKFADESRLGTIEMYTDCKEKMFSYTKDIVINGDGTIIECKWERTDY